MKPLPEPLDGVFYGSRQGLVPMILSAENCSKYEDDGAMVALIRQIPIRRTVVIQTKYNNKTNKIQAIMNDKWKLSLNKFPKEFPAGSVDQHLYVALRLLGEWWPTDYKLELELVGYSSDSTGYTFTFNYTSHEVN